MRDVEQRLRELRPAVEWPPTPDLAAPVLRRIHAAPAPAARRARLRPRLALALALALLVPAAAAFGDDLLEWLGVEGAEVRRVEKLPPAERPLLADLGERTTLAQAERRARFDVAVPSDLGPPDEIRFEPANRVVTLVYDAAGDPLIVAQVPGALERDIIQKLVTTSTVREVRVRGRPGIYVSGEEHGVFFRLPGGGYVEDRPRLAGDTLLFNHRDTLVRIESRRLPLDRALAIAESLRP